MRKKNVLIVIGNFNTTMNKYKMKKKIVNRQFQERTKATLICQRRDLTKVRKCRNLERKKI